MLKRILNNAARSLTRRQRRRRLKPLYFRKRRRSIEAGFILPTVAVVSMVVVLLTAAMAIRSFDRARNASNVRVSQAAAEAAAPAISRAKVKVEAFLRDPALPNRTPSTRSLYNAIKYNSKYTFGDETRLKLGFDINNDKAITADDRDIKNDETLTTAWRFPVDTNNNGRFDTYALYGIYFRSPSLEEGDFNRERNPLEARTPPVEIPVANNRCADILGTNTEVLGSGWYLSSNKLKKSFFVYTASVPITDSTNLGDRFETLVGNTSFYALEYQQDRSLIPLNQYAVWFNDDLELSPSTDFRLNGRIHTNGNLLVGGRNNATVRFYQVDSQDSCFYQPENGKITVGGNVGNGSVTDTSDRNVVTVDLYSNNPANSTAQIGSNNKSTEKTGGAEIAYSDDALNQRIALMKQGALKFCLEQGRDCSELEPPQIKTVLEISRYPDEVKTRFTRRLQDNPSLNTYTVLTEELERYFRHRTRRVPYAEVLELKNDILNDYTQTSIFANVNPIEPPAEWREPTDTNTKLLLRTRQLEATAPAQQLDGIERYLGDRIRVGNNLPAYWKDGNNYVTAPRDRQLIAGVNWTNSNDKPRYRSTQVQPVDNIEIAERDGFWETQAAEKGLRIITGAGIYQNRGNNSSAIPALKLDSFLPDLSKQTKLESGQNLPTPDSQVTIAGESIDKYTLVWSDMMPMQAGIAAPATGQKEQAIEDRKRLSPPDLRMRATAVYHYIESKGSNQIPIACVSSYYDPTDAPSAKNGKYNTENGLPWGTQGNNLPFNNGTDGRSNNGIVYESPYTTEAARTSAIANYLPELVTQAKLMFSNGRLVNQPLQNALKKLTANVTLADPNKPLSLSENAAIDTAICALKILDGSINPVMSNPVIPHGAIREATFLDAREVKALHKSNNSLKTIDLDNEVNNTNYDLDLEQRQPLEIRVTEINLDVDDNIGITRKKIEDKDYLLPNSGIIYASRDDALRDDSAALDFDAANNRGDIVPSITRDRPVQKLESKLLSPTDFRLDPTRRPNGIRLINGRNLSRTVENTYVAAENGLILASNLPVYIKGNFNLHQTPTQTQLEEFLENLNLPNWNNFYTRNTANLNPDFACRPGKSGCPNSNGDTWRPTTIIADTVTLVSGSFQDGFRIQGDFDLRNNSGNIPIGYDLNGNGNKTDEGIEKEIGIDLNLDGDLEDDINEAEITINQIRQLKGFAENNFVTNAVWMGENGFPPSNRKTSYLTNGVTPIQRRIEAPEYVMEICRKLPVESCETNDWVVGYDRNNNKILEASELAAKVQDLEVGKADVEQLGAGTTAKPPMRQEDYIYPRRVAFLRNTGRRDGEDPKTNNSDRSGNSPNNPNTNRAEQSSPARTDSNKNPDSAPVPAAATLRLVNDRTPVPIGIDNSGKVNYFPYSRLQIGKVTYEPFSTRQPRSRTNALWFRTTSNTTNPTQLTQSQTVPNAPLAYQTALSGRIPGEQPLLVPVLQIHSPVGNTLTNNANLSDRWLQGAAEDTTFNAVFMAGNSPSRPQEESAGLPNFVRLLENWQNRIVNINGSFIQMWRSAYATAPFMPIRRDPATGFATATDNLSWFDYSINRYPTNTANNDLPTGTPPYYSESIRNWRFDVALLSQPSDLFAQEFTTPSTSQPNELLRDVSRDDPWIQTLLCAAVASDRTGKATATYDRYAIPGKEQRPATCQNDTPDYPANFN
jgi:hypothetical protein